MFSPAVLKKLNHTIKNYEDRFMPSKSHTRPIHMFVDVTSRCNIDCFMCWRQYAQDTTIGDMSLDTFKKVVPLMDYMDSVVLQGSGEPFFNREFIPMLRLAGEHTSGIRFATNGTMMTEANAEELVKNRVHTVMISLDAAKQETYEKIRRGSKWEHVIRNLEKLINVKERMNSPYPEITFEYVLMRTNVEELDEFVRLAHKYKVKYVGIRHVWIFGESVKNETMFLYPELMQAKFTEAAQLGQELGVTVDLPSLTTIKFAEDYVIDQLNDPALSSLAQSVFTVPGPGKVCYDPWRNYWVTWEGNVRPCCQTDRIMGNVNDASFLDIWNGPAYRLFREKLSSGDYPKECLGCRNLKNPKEYESIFK